MKNSLLLLCICSTLQAQQVLKSELNLPRSGDELVKKQVMYVSPGNEGQDCIWDFSRLTLAGDENEYILNYSDRGSERIVGTENSSHFYYNFQGDSLLLEGFENATDLAKFHTPQLLLKFPAAYGSESNGFIHGRGKYCDRLEYVVLGKVETRADGYGKLILSDQDTLVNVMRVHIKKLIKEHYQPISMSFDLEAPFDPSVGGDSILKCMEESGVIQTDIYQWYAEGYRYPVIETVKRERHLNGDSIPIFKTAFLCHPIEQQLLAEDKANQSLRDEKLQLRSQQATALPENVLHENIHIYPNPVIDNLQINMELSHPETVQVFLYDMTGRLLYKSNARKAEGYFSETVEMGAYMKGSYVIRIQTGDKSERKVIVKQ